MLFDFAGMRTPVRFHHFRGLQVHLLPSRFLGRETEETFNSHASHLQNSGATAAETNLRKIV
jgi:hypothetical protein